MAMSDINTQTQPYLIAIHYVAHRLSLAAADGIALLEKYEHTLNAIYNNIV